jgi:hypothetical protein
MTSEVNRRRAKREAATRVAAETLRHVAAQEWHAEREFMRKSRGKDLTIDEVTEAIGTKTAKGFSVAMQILVDNALHAPTAQERRKNAEILAKVHLAERELKLKFFETYRALDAPVEMPSEKKEPVVLQELPELPPMTDEQLTELIQLRRKGLSR